MPLSAISPWIKWL